MTDSETAPPIVPRFSMMAVGGSTAVLAVGVGIGQVSGLLRSLFVASAVGLSPSFDAILVAIVVPTILGHWLSNTVRIVMVPVYRSVTYRSGELAARRLLGSVITYVFAAAVVSVILVVALSAPIVAVTGPGLTQDASSLAVAYVPVLAPMLAFMAMSNVLIAVFQLSKSYRPVAIAWAAGPTISLLVTVLLWDQLGIGAYAVGTTVGSFATLVVITGAALRHRLLPRPSFRADPGELRAFARRALPQSLASGVLQLNLISDRAIATLLATGAASALKYGQQIVSEPAAAISTSWATVVYPAVVDASGPHPGSTMGAAMTTALRYTVAVFVPLAMAAASLAPLAVALIYGRGAFDAQAVQTTAFVVAAFGPMLVLTMAQPVFSAAHNARHRGTLMALTGIANAILNVVLNVAFGAAFGVAGIALSSSVTLGVMIAFLAWRVPADEDFRIREVSAASVRALAASLVPGIPIALFVWSNVPGGTTVDHALTLIALMVAGAIGYILSARLFGLREPGIILAALLKGARRRFAPAATN